MIRGEYLEDYGLGEVLNVTYRKHAVDSRKRWIRGNSKTPVYHLIPEVDEFEYINYDDRLDFLRQVAAGQAIYRGPECETFIDNEIKLYHVEKERASDDIDARRAERLKPKRKYFKTKPKGYQPVKYESTYVKLTQFEKDIKLLLKTRLVRNEYEARVWHQELKEKYAHQADSH